MKYLAIFAFLASAAASSLRLDTASFEAELMGIEFHSWTEVHGKEYNCEHEKAKRFDIYRKNHGE